MENTDKNLENCFDCPSLDSYWRRIMAINDMIKLELEDEKGEPQKYHTDLMKAYDDYYALKTRVDRQIAYEVEMKKRRIVLLPKDKRKSDEWGSYLLITINPDPSKLSNEQDIRGFIAECNSFYRSYVFDGAEYVFEQRGKQEGDYHGIHCHAVVHRVKTPFKVRQEIKRRFLDSKLCGTERHIDVKTVSESELNETRNYLTGMKKGKNKKDGLDKQEKQENDKRFREHYGLEAVYYAGGGNLLVPPTK